MATPKPMCAVTIGFETYVLPSAAGMKLVEPAGRPAKPKTIAQQPLRLTRKD